MSIIGYIHVCQQGDWLKSFNMLLDCIKSSGLYEKLLIIRIGILTNEEVLPFDEMWLDPKFKIIHLGKPHEYERPTILHMRNASEHDNGLVKYFYLHTKGLRHFNTDRELNVIDWINMMLYWNIHHFDLALEKLDIFDTYGCDDLGDHYSGNFWWATKSHMQTLPKSIAQHYNAPEEYVLLKNENKYCAHSSNINHYLERYPKELYVIDAFTQERPI